MSKFRKNDNKELPPISTASLPDIVFMLLFFFMVTTQMREQDLKVIIKLPDATELSKLEKKSVVSFIYVGEPQKQYQKAVGLASQIQLNDKFADVGAIRDFVITEKEAMSEEDQPFMITSLKVDQNTKMGIVTEIKQELRKAAALHINYSSRKKVER